MYRDVFLLLTYTGLSYGDATKLKMSDIFLNNNGKKFIQKQRGKTKQSSTILLIPRALNIINKYAVLPESLR